MFHRNQISGTRQYDFVSQFSYIREAGTSSEEKAANAIQDYLKTFGMNSYKETFKLEFYEPIEGRLIVTSPYEKEYQVVGYEGAQNTPDEGLEAPFLYVEDADDISLSHAKGTIVMMNKPITRNVYHRLIEAGIVALVSIIGTPIDTDNDWIVNRLHLPKSCSTLSAANIHYNDAVELVTREASTARLFIKQKKMMCTSQNIIARIEGTDKAAEILTLTAHYDSVPAGPGAYDNMSGSAIIMELCRYFAKHRPRRTLEFIWFGAEEKGLLGSQHYVNTHEAELLQHQFNMNVDLAGQLVGGNVLGITGNKQIGTALTKMAREIDLGVSVKYKVWAGDSNSFAWKGVPAMTLNRDGFGMHTKYDTIDLISPWSLQRSATLLGYIAEQLAQIDEIPFPREIPEEFSRQLEAAFHS